MLNRLCREPKDLSSRCFTLSWSLVISVPNVEWNVCIIQTNFNVTIFIVSITPHLLTAFSHKAYASHISYARSNAVPILHPSIASAFDVLQKAESMPRPFAMP